MARNDFAFLTLTTSVGVSGFNRPSTLFFDADNQEKTLVSHRNQTHYMVLFFVLQKHIVVHYCRRLPSPHPLYLISSAKDAMIDLYIRGLEERL